MAVAIGILFLMGMVLAAIVATRGLILIPVVLAVVIAMKLFPELKERVFGFLNPRGTNNARLERARQLGELLALSPKEFEQTMGMLLKLMGFPRVECVGGAGDLSVDLRGMDQRGAYFVAQCKRYAPEHKVGSIDVQQFIGMATVHHRAQRLLYFTTSTYTAPAIELAKHHAIELFSGDDIVRIANRLSAQQAGKGH